MEQPTSPESVRAGVSSSSRSNSLKIRGEDSATIGNVCQGTKDWDGTDHPYYELSDLIEEAMFARTRWKAIRVLKGVRCSLTRFERLTHTPDRLTVVRDAIVSAIRLLDKRGAAARKVPEQILRDARVTPGKMIVADEDLKFPGCRTEEGEFLEDKARETLNSYFSS